MTCPRCSGPLFAQRDQHGSYASCLYCGYVAEEGAMTPEDRRREREGRHRVHQPHHRGRAL